MIGDAISLPRIRRAARRRLAVETLEARDVPAFAAPTLLQDQYFTMAVDVTSNDKADLVGLVAGTEIQVRRDNGTFAAPSPTSVQNLVASGDFNGDGTTDLVGVDANVDLVILFGNGQGGFTEGPPRTFYPVDGSFYNYYGFAAAFVNGDTNLDLVTSGYGLAGLQFLYGDGAGGFTQSGLLVGNILTPPIASDLNGDGDVDVAVDQGYDPNTGTFGDYVAVFTGDGAGGFGTLAGSPFAIPYADKLVAGNFSGDEATDLAFLDGRNLYVLKTSGSGAAATLSLSDPVSVNTGSGSPTGLFALDTGLTGYDGLAISVGSNTNGSWVVGYRGSNAGPTNLSETQHVGVFLGGAAAADFDGDGVTDMALVATGGGIFAPPKPNGTYIFRNQDQAGPPPTGGARLRSHWKVTYQDIDGDIVTLTVKPKVRGTKIFHDGDINNVLIFDRGGVNDGTTGGQQLQRIYLDALESPLDAAGMTLTITAAKHRGQGNGKVNVGSLQGTVDLKSVSIKGDLGRIYLGNGTLDASLETLSVASMGAVGTTTQGTGGDLYSIVFGTLGSLKISGDFWEANLLADNIERISVGGRVKGGDLDGSGSIHSGGDIENVVLGKGRNWGQLEGGIGKNSGVISSARSIKSIRLNQILGGDGEGSGRIASTRTLERLIVRNGIIGGIGKESGRVEAGAMGDLSIGVGLFGGAGDSSGNVISHAGITKVDVGAVSGSFGQLSGRIEAAGAIDSLAADLGVSGGNGDASGSVSAWSFGTLWLKRGSLQGGTGPGSGTIDARGHTDPVTGQFVAGGIGSATIAFRGSTGVIGGSGAGSGRLDVSGWLKELKVDHVFGASDGSGVVAANTIGTVTVYQNVEGGAGVYSGRIESTTDFTKIVVMGNLLGGNGDRSGRIESLAGNLYSLDIKGVMVAGIGSYSGNVSAAYLVETRIGGIHEALGRWSGVLESHYVPENFEVKAPPRILRAVPSQASGVGLALGEQRTGGVISRGGGTVVMAANQVISRGGGTVISRGAGS